MGPPLAEATLGLEDATAADLLVSFNYHTPPHVVKAFARSALVDIDPGLLQLWMSSGALPVPEHDVYFTIGETVGTPEATFPDAGIEWHFTPPWVDLSEWQPGPTPPDAPFTTITHWYEDDWIENGDGWYLNNKREGFLPFASRQSCTCRPLMSARTSFKRAISYGGLLVATSTTIVI